VGNGESVIKQNLQYIFKSLQAGTHLEQRAILSLMIEETVQEIHNTAFKYLVEYTSEDNTEHLQMFIAHGKKAKWTLLSDMEELKIKLNNGNTKSCLKLVQNMLKTDLYKQDVQAMINNWKSTSRTNIKTRTIYVK
jgi:hypothetical protein